MQQIPFEQLLREDTLLGPGDTSGGLGARGRAGAGPGPEVAGKVFVGETGSRSGGGKDPLLPAGQSWGRCELRPLGEPLPVLFPDVTPGCFSSWEQHTAKASASETTTVPFNSWSSLRLPHMTSAGVWGVPKTLRSYLPRCFGSIQMSQRAHSRAIRWVFCLPGTGFLLQVPAGPILTPLPHALPK